MMRWIIGSSLKFRFLVVAVAATMVFLGLGQLGQLPVDVFPEFAPPRVEIQTACIGLSASEVEAWHHAHGGDLQRAAGAGRAALQVG